MSRSIHENLSQLRNENPTKKDFDELTNDDKTLSQLSKKRKIK